MLANLRVSILQAFLLPAVFHAETSLAATIDGSDNLVAGNFSEFSEGLAAGANPQKIVIGPDGNLWFTELDVDLIGRITPSGEITEFSEGITAGAGPFGLTVGPDGALWFTEYHGNRIGRITTDGTVSEFSSPLLDGTSPRSICTGADGNLWFTQLGTNAIGMMTPKGDVAVYAGGISANAGPFDIAAGGDGNLWFTENYAGGEFPGGIARITPKGVVTEFDVGIGGSGQARPGDIAADAQGNLWFGESGFGIIGHMTTDGTLTEFGNISGGVFNGIAVGPGGYVWFTESDDRIGMLAPDGNVLEFTGMPHAEFGYALPNFIVAGPDGNLWHTEQQANRIGRLNIEIFSDGFEQ